MKKPVSGTQTIRCAECNTRNCSVLKNCSPECLDLISDLKRVGYFIAGQRIIMEGSLAKGIYFIESGQVKLFKTDSRGQELLLRFAAPGDVIGYSVSENSNEYEVSAMAVLDTRVCFIDFNAYLNLTTRFPEFAFELLKFYSRELSRMEQKSLKLATMTVPQKVADAILVMESAFGSSGEMKPLNLVLSRQDIANLAGTTKEQVSKVISDLSSRGIVDTKGKLISILQRDKLKELARN